MVLCCVRLRFEKSFPRWRNVGREGKIVTPRYCGYRDVTATYIRRLEIPSYIYAKHQCRLRVQKYVMLYMFQYMSIITKLSQNVTQYYTNITSPIWRNCENIKWYTIMNCAKGTHESQRKNLRVEQGGLEG